MAEWITGNRFLNLEEMQNNAQLFANQMRKYKWTKNAIAGALGNIQTESSINPGIWENLDEYAGGYGLVQWTPYTKYSNWAGEGWQDNGDKECERINYEVSLDGTPASQWYATEVYPMSFEEYINSKESPEYLAQVWLYNYERPGDLNQPARSTQARYWYEHIRIGPPAWLLLKMSEENRKLLKGGIV